MTEKIKPIFNSFKEYIQAEDMIFETLQDRVTHSTKDKE
jgi:hypothetical protein